MRSDNIFDIWRYIGRGTPFIVRRNGWFHLSYMVIIVKPRERYGDVYGYKLIDGKPENNNITVAPIDCCGCGNWELVENLIENVEHLKWNCLDKNNNLTFGKYKGINAEELKTKDAAYYKWALCNVGGFGELLYSQKYDVSLQLLLNIKKQIKNALNFTADDWIKSPVDSNFDFTLDQYKYACCTKAISIETAVKEIEECYHKSLHKNTKK